MSKEGWASFSVGSLLSWDLDLSSPDCPEGSELQLLSLQPNEREDCCHL